MGREHTAMGFSIRPLRKKQWNSLDAIRGRGLHYQRKEIIQFGNKTPEGDPTQSNA